jgi:hypothetical protein
VERQERQPFLYSVERVIKAELSRIWHAWTQPQALEAWYHPVGLAALPETVTSHAVVDGPWAVSVDVPDHNLTAYCYGRYTAVINEKLLEHTMLYTESATEFEQDDLGGPSHLVSVSFEQREVGVWVKFSQFGELPEGHAPRAQAGMESYFDSLENYLGQI